MEDIKDRQYILDLCNDYHQIIKIEKEIEKIQQESIPSNFMEKLRIYIDLEKSNIKEELDDYNLSVLNSEPILDIYVKTLKESKNAKQFFEEWKKRISPFLISDDELGFKVPKKLPTIEEK